LVIEYTQDKARTLFKGPIKVHSLTFVDKKAEYFPNILNTLNEIASINRNDFLHVYIPKTEDKVLQYFELKDKDLPATLIVDMRIEGQMKKYKFPHSEITALSLLEFEDQFLSNQLKLVLKSAEPSPSDDLNPVKVIVGKTFDEKVMKSDADVLLEFYAPWCGHCKSLAPKYDELAEKFLGNDRLIIAKIDYTANEVDHSKISVKGFPTIYFFPNGKKDSPILFNESREVDGFLKFLNVHTSHKINDEL